MSIFSRASGILAATAIFVVLQLQPLTCIGSAGDLDLSFGGTGKIKFGFGGGSATARAVVAQPDGKLILAGTGNGKFSLGHDNFLIARVNTNNLLDNSFGDGGKVLTRVNANGVDLGSTIQAVRLQSDGKILAAGFAYLNPNYPSFAIVRYNTNGSLDTTFGTNGTGMVFADFGVHSEINALLIQPDRITVAGFTEGNGGSAFALARYDTNGVLDPTFGTGGITTTFAGNDFNRAYSFVTEADGKYVVVGSGIGSGDNGIDIAMFRYTTNGVLDNSFGGGTGQVFTRISPVTSGYDSAATAVGIFAGNQTVQNPDRILVAGTYEDHQSTTKSYLALLRYNLDGTLDTSFGHSGIVTNFNPSGSIAELGLAVSGIFPQPRKITLGASYGDGSGSYFALQRFTTAGDLDTTFGTNGTGIATFTVASPADGSGAVGYTMVSTPAGLVMAGYRATSDSESDFAAARFTSAGLVDTNFGTNGLLLANVSDTLSQANAVTVQNDSKIVVAGSTQAGNNGEHPIFALARLNLDGSPDTSFGLNGKVRTHVSTNDTARALAIQPDGKIVAGGDSFGLFALARYNSDGSQDTNFGVNGTVLTPIGANNAAINTVRIQPDGKIVAGGYASDGSTARFALARYNPNGTLDTNFGSAGKIITSFTSEDDAYALGLQSNGKIVLGGFTAFASGSTATVNFALARYNTNGAADFSFGSLGRAQGNTGGGTLNVGYGLAIQSDGRILIAGSASLGSLSGPIAGNPSVNSFVGVMRFNTNGTPDNSFGNGGAVLTEVGNFSDFATSLVLQPDGKILVAGATQNGAFKFFALRYLTDGTPDDSYGVNGVAYADFGSATNEIAYALALDPSGRAVLAGDAGGAFGLARLQGDFVVSPQLKIFLTSTNTVVVSWPYPSAGWDLQQNSILNSGSWGAPVQTVNNDGTNNFIVVTPALNNSFYRLSTP